MGISRAEQSPKTSSNGAIAILLARGGSKGVPGKNLRKIGGLTLVARSVRAARRSENVSAIYVSTDDALIAEEASRYGAQVIDRPTALSGDEATSESGWLHALNQIRTEIPNVDRLVFLQCTSPFTTGADIDGCLAAMEKTGASCALSVNESHAFLWTVGPDGFAHGANHDEQQQRQRRQDLPPSFAESGAVYCVRVADFERLGRRFCGKVAHYVVDHPPVEIDTLEDLEICETLAQQKDSAVIPREQFSGIKAFVMDFDGVHTDDRAYIDQNGMESVVVSRRDGLGIEMLRNAGRCQMLILSKETNRVVMRRAKKLKIECLQSCDDKVRALSSWLHDKSISWDETLYVGNDINDIPAMEKAGLSACPSDAHPAVKVIADWVVPERGGRGAVRSIAEALLVNQQ